jgi:hypothetical protein
MSAVFKYIRAYLNGTAWTLMLLGLALFAMRLPVPEGILFNFPQIVTIVQTAGLVFFLFGLQIIVSIAFWPDVDVGALMNAVLREDSKSAALSLMGLFIFNGLTFIGCVMWLTSAIGAMSARGAL